MAFLIIISQGNAFKSNEKILEYVYRRLTMKKQLFSCNSCMGAHENVVEIKADPIRIITRMICPCSETVCLITIKFDIVLASKTFLNWFNLLKLNNVTDPVEDIRCTNFFIILNNEIYYILAWYATIFVIYSFFCPKTLIIFYTCNSGTVYFRNEAETGRRLN